ncbi:hypothetical protein G9F71_008540 [Clostridium sp. FP2]|uniref:hypothetical protein n=1 Tax=Clostridium sp. FP2 TaxID=2724481 RepID=UPI0013E9107E|nr:hypothetical protein [Clostridium sp. FP2]MBZ9622900.1 hypothetical protein [Clostridium sp. FP2]
MILFDWLKRNKKVAAECYSAPGESRLAKLFWNEKLGLYEDDFGNLFEKENSGNGLCTLKKISIFDERFLKHI